MGAKDLSFQHKVKTKVHAEKPFISPTFVLKNLLQLRPGKIPTGNCSKGKQLSIGNLLEQHYECDWRNNSNFTKLLIVHDSNNDNTNSEVEYFDEEVAEVSLRV